MCFMLCETVVSIMLGIWGMSNRLTDSEQKNMFIHQCYSYKSMSCIWTWPRTCCCQWGYYSASSDLISAGMFTYWASSLGLRQLISAWTWYSLQFKVCKMGTMWLSTSCLLCKFVLCLPCKQCCTSITLQNWYFNILHFQHHCNDEPDFYLQCNEQL